MKKRATLSMAMLALLAIALMMRQSPVVVIDGLDGPAAATPVGNYAPTSWRAYEDGDPGRLAVLLTDTVSSWLGLVHGLKSIGIPFRLTRDIDEAIRHRVVLVYPTISGAVLGPESLRALARLPQGGGTLVGINVEGGGLGPVFGFSGVSPNRSRRELIFDTTHAIGAQFTHERERRMPFSNPERGALAAGSLGYLGATAPLAVFDDGTAAITSRQIGTGFAYAFGVDPGFLLSRGYGNREEGISRSYANGYEPALDVLLRTLLSIYQAGEPVPVTLHTVPEGRDLTVLLTHDIDYGESLDNIGAYAREEAAAGVPATYFIQTKYVRDWNDEAFFRDGNLGPLEILESLDMEVGSHSVAHSLQFNEMPLGTGEERYPAYRPFVRNEGLTEGGTILGELRVSRFLLEQRLAGTQVVSFRPGHLRNPYALPEALAATGYRFSSSVTAGNSLSHLPFRLTEGRRGTTEVDVFEFPVTIEDEEAPPLLDRVAQSLEVAGRLALYGGLFVVLIHTDEADDKLEFQQQVVSALSQNAWFGTVEQFGLFWAGRDQVDLDVAENGNTATVSLRADRRITGLTLRVPSGFRVLSMEPSTLTHDELPGRLVLGEFEGVASIILTRTPR